MRIDFWLLDVNYEVAENRAQIWLWGIDATGQRILIIDDTFPDYFYAVVEEGNDPLHVAETINVKHLAGVTKTEVVDRRFFGKPVKAVKIFLLDPDFKSKSAKAVRTLEGVKECFEDDIRYSMRYLIDNNVVPCGWHTAEVTQEKTRSDTRVDCIFKACSSPKSIEKDQTPKLRILGFSTVCYSREGSPKPDRNPVIMISTMTNDREQKQFVSGDDKNDEVLLREFTAYLRMFDPDVIVGYGVNSLDWGYLRQRCKLHGMSFFVDRTKTEPHTSTYGHVSITGRANVDLLDYADEFPEVKVKTLENLADYLGVTKIAERIIIEDVDIPDYWNNTSKRSELKKSSMQDAMSILGVADAVLDFAMQLSNLVSIPLDHAGTAAAGFRVEWFLIKNTHIIGELAPKRIEQPYRPYAGAIVLNPKQGLHEGIANLDFKSMYPSLMIAYNLSPDSYVAPKDPLPSSGVYEAPEVKHRFRKEPAGFYKEILSQLIRVRDQIRSEMKKASSRSYEYRVLDARQKAVKVITNATYGYAGWTGARWYAKPVAEAAAAWGRHAIQTAIKVAEDIGLNVVYGDTDSLFVTDEKEKITLFGKKIEDKLGLEIKPDKVYTRIFFTEAKKRYAGLLPDGSLDIVGLEVMRGDWAQVAKEVQEKVLEIVLRDRSPEKAADFVRSYIAILRQKEVPYRNLIIWKTLSKDAEEYEVRASHVEAARMLKEKGWELTVGDKVGYVIIKGSGKLFEKVKPYVFAKYDDVDIDYYVMKQVVPAAARILEYFGISPDDLLSEHSTKKGEKSLTEYFGR